MSDLGANFPGYKISQENGKYVLWFKGEKITESISLSAIRMRALGDKNVRAGATVITEIKA